MKLPVALAASPPQKNVGAAARPMGSSQTRACRLPGANPLLARVAGDPLLLQNGDGGTASHSDQMAVAPVPKSGLAGRRRYSCEAARHVKRFALLQNVEAGPRQVLVAVLGVPFPFFPAIAAVHTVDATGVRGEISSSSEAVDRPRFEQDGGRQHLADARYAGKESELRSPAELFLQTLFKEIDLHGQRRDDGHGGLDRKRHIVRQQHLIDRLGRQTLDLIAADPRTVLASGDVLDSKDVRGATAYPLHALSGQIAYRASLRRQDGAGGQYPQPQQCAR